MLPISLLVESHCTSGPGIKCGLQFVDQTGVEVLNDRPIL